MKTKWMFFTIMILGIIISSCTNTEKKTDLTEVKVDLLDDQFPEAKMQLRMTLDSIKQSVMDGNLDELIAFHSYSPKFTEFKNGEIRNGAKDNEEFERGVFGSVTEVLKFDMNDTKIAVYGDVANVTTHTDFHLKFENDTVVINDQMTILFLNTNEGWRIVHEHHSALNSAGE
jgi:ketosteroid isomerase-like protein